MDTVYAKLRYEGLINLPEKTGTTTGESRFHYDREFCIYVSYNSWPHSYSESMQCNDRSCTMHCKLKVIIDFVINR